MNRLRLKQTLAQGWWLLAFLVGALLRPLRFNFSMGLLAVALSTSIWVFITNEQNPPRTGIFPTRIPVQPVNVSPHLDILGPIESVVLRITAPSDLWNSLTENSFEVTMDLAETEEGEHLASLQAKARDPRVRVLDVVPSSTNVRLDTLRKQVVPVRVNLQQAPPLGFSYEQVRVEVDQVTVLGPEALVSLVDAAVADVNLSAARSTLKQSVPLVPRTSRGYDISGVRLEPHTVVIEVPITRHINYVSLAVVADLQGSPPPGYWVSQARVIPSNVTVLGPQDVVQPLGVLRTLPIELANQVAAFSRNIGLDVPQDVTLVDRNLVRVEVSIQPVQGTAVFQVAPQSFGMPTGFFAQTEVPSIEVLVGGEGPLLRELTVEKIAVYLNLTGRGPGSYSVTPDVRLPPGLRVIRVLPERLTVTVR